MGERRSIWGHRDFVRQWSAESVSRFGSQVSLLALPLIAITALHTSTFQVGLLSTMEFLPFVLIGLPAGVWVDRLRRRPVLIAANLGRALALASIPLAHALGVLSMAQLYAVAFATGVLTVFFDVAYQSYLPRLVLPEQLVEGNAKLEISNSGASIAGPGLAGLLIQLLTAPVAVVADAASFLASAAFIGRIRRREPPPPPARAGGGMRREIAEGLRYVLGHRLLRWTAATTATSNLFSAMTAAILVLYLVRHFGMSPGLIGLVMTVGNAGWLLGATGNARLSRRLGAGRRSRPVAGRGRVPAVAGQHHLQHRPAQRAAGDHPAQPPRQDERHHALHGLGHAAARLGDRRRARPGGRPAAHAVDRRGRRPAAGRAGAGLADLVGAERRGGGRTLPARPRARPARGARTDPLSCRLARQLGGNSLLCAYLRLAG